MNTPAANTFIDLKIILPQKKSECDKCIGQLNSLLQKNTQIDEAVLSDLNGKPGFLVHYQPDAISLPQVKALVQLAGAQVANHFKHKSFQIKGMSSPDCANIIEHFLKDKEGILSAKASYASQTLRLEFDESIVNINTIIKELEHLGYKLSDKNIKASWWQKNHEIIYSLLSGLLLLLAWFFERRNNALGLAFVMGSYLSAGWLTLRHSIYTLLQKRFDIDVLMVVAAIGAASIGQWKEGALLLFLFSLGHALEHKAMAKARSAIKSLANLQPTSALVIRNNLEIEIDIEELELGEQVIVKPGQKIPVDGEISSGSSSIDQSSITGESIPVLKDTGDDVFAGTVNGEGLITVTVKASANDSLLSRMVQMVLEAETQKSPSQQFTDKFVRRFVPTVIVMVLALIFIPPLFGASWMASFYRAMAVLVAASPCALAIATPSAILSGVARAAQKGVLIKGGMHLENLSLVRVMAFDKTGTLTQGKPSVQHIAAFDNYTENDVLAMAASIEKLSAHPLAHTIYQAALDKQLMLVDISDMQSITGRGLRGKYQQQWLEVGNLKLFDDVPGHIESKAIELSNKGLTIMIVKYHDNWLGIIALADALRSEAKATIEALQTMGITKTVMLTGDNQRIANSIAEKIGITDVKAELLPEDKLSLIEKYKQEVGGIAMIGDGVNDAPAMAKATVGIAMGGGGSDVALEASDVALMSDDLTKLPFAIGLSKMTRRIIQQNLRASLSIVLILLIATMTGYAGIGIAVLIHEGSTLAVVANALRLLRY